MCGATLPRVDGGRHGQGRGLSEHQIAAQAALYEAAAQSRKQRAHKSLELVQAWDALRHSGFGKRAATEAVSHKFGVSPATVSRMLERVDGVPGHVRLYFLLDDLVGRTATAGMSAEAWEELKRDYLRKERPTAKACIKRLLLRPEASGWTLPSMRTMERRLQALPRGVRVLKREGLQALKELYPPQQRDTSALHAMQIVNADGYEHNVWVRDELGRVFRPKTWFWQDVYSRKILAWRIGETEHTEQIQFSFGAMCRQWGIPSEAVLDNTMAAANKTMSGGVQHRFRFPVREEEPDGIFKLLQVRVRWTTPRHGQAKPIERLFGIGGIGEYVDKAPELAGAWTGSNVLDKPDYDGRKRAVPIALLESVIERWVAALNAMPGRRGAQHNGRSFDEIFAQSYEHVHVVKATEEQERLWLLSTEAVQASARDGAITLDAGRVQGERLANRYWDSALVDYAGRKLVAKFDPRRLHLGVHVYTLDGRWICYAACDRPAGFNDQAAARERNRSRNAFMRAQKELAEHTVRMEALDHRKAQALPELGGVSGGTIPAPKVLRPIFKDPLERPRYVPRERTAEEAASLEALEREMSAPAPVNVMALSSDAAKHAHWKTLDARRAAGEALAEAEADFWRAWQSQDYYRIAVDADREFEQMLAARHTAA